MATVAAQTADSHLREEMLRNEPKKRARPQDQTLRLRLRTRLFCHKHQIKR
jgi:hypothetical protein